MLIHPRNGHKLCICIWKCIWHTQVLTFLRCNVKSKGHDGFWYVLNVPELKRHVQRKGNALPPSFLASVATLYQGQCRLGVLQLFLKPGVSMKYVQCGLEGRKSDSNVYVRAVMIKKEVISAEATVVLDKGIIIICCQPHKIKYVTLHI